MAELTVEPKKPTPWVWLLIAAAVIAAAWYVMRDKGQTGELPRASLTEIETFNV